MGSPPRDCSTCRFAATDKRKKIIDATGFDDQMMFEDHDEIVYSCKAFGDDRSESLSPHAGKVIGIAPISCDGWARAQQIAPEKAAELDSMVLAYEARMKEREAKERK